MLPSLTHPVGKNVLAVAELERQTTSERSFAARVTDAVAGSAGTLVFALGHAAWFSMWMAANTHGATFDPYPFNLLTLIVSLEAILLTSIVLMTQARMTHQADRRAALDLQINLLAEQELTAMLDMLRAICVHHSIDVSLRAEEVEQLLQETDVQKISAALDDSE